MSAYSSYGIEKEIYELSGRINGISSAGQLMVIKKKVQEKINDLMGVLDTKINTIVNTAKFDVSKVKELPPDIISYIREFMEDDVERVRKAYCITSFIRCGCCGEVRFVGDFIIHHKKKKLLLAVWALGYNYITMKNTKKYICDSMHSDLAFIAFHWDWNDSLPSQNISKYSLDGKYKTYQLVRLLCG